MEKEYADLREYKIAFKHLISGPAPVGRILNYVILTGKGILKHRNGNRNLTLNNGVASAWCSEFMVGLGLAFYVEEKDKTVYPLYLTENGKRLYSLIKDVSFQFDESEDPNKCRKQLTAYSKEAYGVFFDIFRASAVCKNLRGYIKNSGTQVFKKDLFKDNYFDFFRNLYEGTSTGKPGSRNAGFNRVPSLIQLCKFFNCLEEDKDYYKFNYKELLNISSDKDFIDIDDRKYEEINKESQRNEKIVSDLVSRYGIDGNVAREIVTRNSSVQDLFRNNLIARYGCKCAICSKKIETVLVASHIVPASEANVMDKANCENGLLLCALHDKLFDRYLISFDYNTGKLLYADVLSDALSEYQLSDSLQLENRFMTEERRGYLSEHNKVFYDKNP